MRRTGISLIEVTSLEGVCLKSISDHSWGLLLGYIEDPDVSFPAGVEVLMEIMMAGTML